ncbi:MAG: hypothetical protein RLZZ508_564 [Actinomycetota bacterium]
MQFIKQGATSLLKILVLTVTLYFASLLGIRIAGYEFTVVVSDSMNPGISRGDLVILQAVDEELLAAGDIIQYRRGEESILHRIVEIQKKGIRTKGDANLGEDPVLVGDKQIIARAVGVLRGFGNPAFLMQTIFGINPAKASFTNQHARLNALKSTIWTDPVAKWKQVSGGGTFTFTSPSQVVSNGNGNRVILLTKNKPTDQNFYTMVRLTAKDVSSPVLQLNLEVCAATSITCGWVIGINETSKTIYVQTYSQTGSRETPIYSRQQAINLGVETKIICHISNSLLQLRIDDVTVLSLPNPYLLAQSKGVTIPNGSYFGISTTNSNQFKSSKTMTW